MVADSHGYKVWFDQRSLIAGQEWEIEIKKAIAASRVFMPLISSRAISARGYFQKELRRSLSVAEEVPEGTAYIIAVLLDCDCARSLPDALRKYHYLILTGMEVGEQSNGATDFARFWRETEFVELQRALDFALRIDRR
jgi:TIR domain